MDSRKKTAYLTMTALVFGWGLEYIFAKQVLAVMEPLTLLFFKYLVAAAVCLAIKLKAEGRGLMRKKDIPIFVLCAIVGEVGYFYMEYSAIGYLPVSLVTIILAMVPALSIIVDRVFYGKKATKKIALGVLLSIAGIVLVVGTDWRVFFQGRLIGYLLAFGAVISWTFYNFLTASLHDRYRSVTLALNQILCSLLMIAPWALAHLPDAERITPTIVGQVLFLGVLCTALGLIIYVKSLDVLGPTVTAMFSNFLPVTTTVFGWLILKESILPVQMAGGAMVILAGCLVIKEKGRLEELSDDGTR